MPADATTIELAPAVIVYDRAQIDAVLAFQRPVTLVSPPGFALYAGWLWWKTLLAQAGFTSIALLDCADAAGRVVDALRGGIGGIVFAARPDIFALVASIGQESGALVLDKAPPAIDLAQWDAMVRLPDWLGAADGSKERKRQL